MASTGEAWRLGRRPALDGLRGVAVLLVVASHAMPQWFGSAGIVGVSMFFALSGFLITTLLLEERDDRGRISLAAFYRRRAVRLLPALFVYVSVMVVLSVTVSWRFAPPGSVLPALLYVGNWLPMHDVWTGGLNHTWSLAVEEQFYIAYPLLLIALVGRCSRWSMVALLAAGAAASALWRVSLWASGAPEDRYYFATDVNIGALLIGCTAGVWMCSRRADGSSRGSAATALVATTVLLGLVGDSHASRAVLGPVAAGIAAATIALLTSGPYSGWLTRPWLVLVGRRSYGLYLWHFPLLWILRPALVAPEWVTVPLLLAAAWGLTLASWRYVEQPMQRLRKPVSGGHSGGVVSGDLRRGECVVVQGTVGDPARE